MDFGDRLRELRTTKGLGLKKLAPDLGVTYTYLSKLENSRVRPSNELVSRIADYFGCDQDSLLLTANRVPADVLDILRNNPDEAILLLRRHFGTRLGQPET